MVRERASWEDAMEQILIAAICLLTGIAASAVTPGRQDAGHRAELRQVLRVVPLVELALLLRRDIHRDQQERIGARRRQRIARPDLLPLETDDHTGAAGDPLRPGRAVDAADR